MRPWCRVSVPLPSPDRGAARHRPERQTDSNAGPTLRARGLRHPEPARAERSASLWWRWTATMTRSSRRAAATVGRPDRHAAPAPSPRRRDYRGRGEDLTFTLCGRQRDADTSDRERGLRVLEHPASSRRSNVPRPHFRAWSKSPSLRLARFSSSWHGGPRHELAGVTSARRVVAPLVARPTGRAHVFRTRSFRGDAQSAGSVAFGSRIHICLEPPGAPGGTCASELLPRIRNPILDRNLN